MSITSSLRPSWATHFTALLLLAASAITTTTTAIAAPPSGDPVLIGVSGPLTGQNAQYGAQWKAGFDLALDEINSHDGINGRPLNYVFEDSQSDPRQSITIAQKFVNDPRILIELGGAAVNGVATNTSFFPRRVRT